jgi:hypothetical protein
MFATRNRQGSPLPRRPLRSVVGPDNPIAVVSVYAVMSVAVIVEAATSTISPGNPMFPGFMWLLGAAAGGVWHLLTKRSRAGLQDQCFIVSLAGVMIGFAVYAAMLIATLF